MDRSSISARTISATTGLVFTPDSLGASECSFPPPRAMPVQKDEKRVTIKHTSGASVEVLLYGATILSWKAAPPAGGQPQERLFVSSKAALDGSKPVRGGIPVVFPLFGAPSRPEHSKMPQHGIARSEVWEYDSSPSDDDSAVSARLVLNPTPSISAVFESQFALAYTITLTADSLTTELSVKNPSPDKPLIFQALLHTYFAADSSTVGVSPLKGLTYTDKTKGGIEVVEDRDVVDVKNYTDFVYKGAGGKYVVKWNGGGVDIKTSGFGDVVVWNPQAEAGSKIGDMEAGGWEKYVCVEPGIASYWEELAPGSTWTGSQTLTVL